MNTAPPDEPEAITPPPPPTLGAPPPSAPATATSPVHTAPAPRKRWIVILIAALVSIALLAAAGTALFGTNTYPPLRAAYDFVDDVNDGDARGAYGQLCGKHPLRNRYGFEAFYIAIQDADAIGVDMFSVDRDGDTAAVDVTVVFATRSKTDGSSRLATRGWWSAGTRRPDW